MRTFALLLASFLPALAADPFTARVIHVSDGDTITEEAPGRVIKIRLFGIDCPESKQDYGEHATWFTSQAVLGHNVRIIEHDTDRYGRMVADVVMVDGRILNHELVRTGNAWWYVKYDPDHQELQTLETQAREEHRGLWRAANPIPPWEWRTTPHVVAKRARSRHH